MRFLPGLYSVSLHVFFPQSRRYYLSGKASDAGTLRRCCAFRTAISQAPADVAALLLAGEAGEIITQNDAASELFHLDDGDLLATAFSDEANDLICDCADTGKEQHMTENCFGRLYYLTAVPHDKNVLVVLKPLPNTSKTGAYFACMDTFSRSVTQLHRLLPLVTDPQAAAALTREAGRLQRTAFHLSELLNPPIYGTMRITGCDLSRLCSDAANNVSRRLPEGKRDCIALNVPMQCEAQLDVVRVRAALYNLLTNAVAVSQEPGSVSLTLTVENRPAYDGETIDWAVITVSDRGPGLSADKLESALTDAARAAPGCQRPSVSGHGPRLRAARCSGARRRVHL